MELEELKNIYRPLSKSHKGQNGKLLIIGGSHLFHAASLWSLKVASRIVDLVHYASVDENNKIVQKLKEEFRDGIIVPRREIESYIEEDDCVLIGPGMVRTEISNFKFQISNFKKILEIKDEGELTYYLTKYLLTKYPHKKWVIDAGALQMMEPEWMPQNAIITPHRGELERIYAKIPKSKFQNPNKIQIPKSKLVDRVAFFAKEYSCVVILKGRDDIVVSPKETRIIEGGNAGMTKGGTGDVLAGLTAALYTKNEAFTSAVAASYINKKAGEALFKKMGYWFNASDLADQIPQTMKKLLI